MNRKEFLIDFAYFVCWIAIVYVGFKFLLPIFLPFVFGYLFTVASRKITKNRNTIVLIIFYLTVGLLLVFFGVWFVGKLGSYISRIPDIYRNVVEPYINSVYETLINMNDDLDFPYLSEIVDSGLSALRSVLLSVGSGAAGTISKGIMEIPSLLFSILVFVISSFFFTADYDHVRRFMESSFGSVMDFFREKLSAVLLGYVKIIGITYLELTVGLMILGIKRFYLLAAGIAIVDILPILGCGTILVPWGIISLLNGDIFLGVGILVMHIVIYFVRQYIEPKIVAGNLGIPSILSLISMVVGLRLFGFAGMFGLPLIASYYFYKHPEKTAYLEEKTEEPQEAVTEETPIKPE